MRGAAVWVFVLLAGCSQPAEPSGPEAPISSGPAPPQAAEVEVVNETVEAWNGTLDVYVSQIRALGAISFGTQNCAVFLVDAVTGGTAVATWGGGMDLGLELGIWGHAAAERTTGTSPLRLDFDRHDASDGVRIGLQATDPGVALEQHVRVEVVLEYVGGDPEPQYQSCFF